MTDAARQAHGVLVVDKPSGPTSHDVVSQARRLFGTRKVGHAGTLDPMASGVLLVLLGEATKLAPYLTADDKRYRAVIAFGYATDTLDALGTITERRELAPGWLSIAALETALDVERARTEQVPPSFSAIKIDGQRAHRMARRGEIVDLPARPVQVRSLELIAHDQTGVTLNLCVSKGYYVRSLARDIGLQLGVPAHLQALRRTASGRFPIAEAHAWPVSEPPALLTVHEAAVRALPQALLSTVGADKAIKGQTLEGDDFVSTPPELRDDEPCAWVLEGQLVAIGVKRGGQFVSKRGFSLGC